MSLVERMDGLVGYGGHELAGACEGPDVTGSNRDRGTRPVHQEEIVAPVG